MGQKAGSFTDTNIVAGRLRTVNSHVFSALRQAEPEFQSASQSFLNAKPVRIAGLYGHNPQQNHILAALPDAEYGRFAAELELVSMPTGMVLSEPSRTLQHVYFPTSSIVSILHDTRDGATAETAVIGNEGLVGVGVWLGGGGTSCRAVVTSAGFGFRLGAGLLQDEFERGEALHKHLLRFTQALLTQMSQAAVCNRHHNVAQQLCLWLLLRLDRLPSNELIMTQEMIANMLGVRRESVAEAAGRLQEDNVIHYSRGHITVLDREALERRVCECYGDVRHEYARLLPIRVDTASLAG
ncbi:Crp/Fnr family transcriptional regulator [Janthinobacterium sp. 17J80-10]|uniref:Crp/Fnr family transcriptional regulator n=1 Tax=Janthinobacterium sp. 17J80-10 TaxID=2497863 RepID=UPI0010053C15|nr:Crp/Fnr family transcriptional regulator [Janthinobacterium sp. 17J80-10]QAU34984.1 Crp/Fnr family transcriptional regulator [Janthinobacterium sp. 17J80-10]